MGLAASQARLLFITSRQNDVSAKMQRISNETMILARDEEEVLNKYNQILEGGSTTSYSLANAESITYDQLMGDAAINRGETLVVMSGSAVVLTSSLRDKLGLSGTSGKLPSNINSAQALAAAAGESQTVQNAVAKEAGTYTGDGYSDKKFSVNELLAKLNKGAGTAKDRRFGGGDGYGTGGGGAGLYSDDFNNLCSDTNGVNIYDQKNGNGIYGYFAEGNATHYYQNSDNNDWQNGRLVGVQRKAYSIGELYGLAGQQNGMVMLGSAIDVNGVKDNLLNLTATIGNQLITGLVSGFGLNEDAVTKEVSNIQNSLVNSYISNAIDSKEEVVSQLQPLATEYYGSHYGNQVVDDDAQKFNENAIAVGMTMGRAQHCVVGFRDYGEYDSGSGLRHFVVSAANLVKDMVDNVMLALTGNEVAPETTTGLNDGKTSTEIVSQNKQGRILNKYITGSEDNYTLSGTDTAKARYYIDMYNKLSKGGFVVDDDIETQSNLNAKLTNGTYYINGSHASETLDMVSETTTATDKAQQYWNTEMTKIKRKEDQMNKDLQKLQTEYTSLTTDYESVKSISKKYYYRKHR